MFASSQLRRFAFSAAVRVASLWIRPQVLPETPAETIPAPGRRVCYVLPDNGLADSIALEIVCRRHGLPLPSHGIRVGSLAEAAAVIALRHYRGTFIRTPAPGTSARLARLSTQTDADDTAIDLVPVGIYWGRSPGRESGVFKLAFSERWEFVGRFRKLLTTFLVGRSTLAQFSPPLALDDALAEGLSPERTARKVSRILRVHSRQRRTAVLGPDLSHKRTLVDKILLSEQVRRAIDRRKKRHDGYSREDAEKDARRYALEIVADFSYPTVRIMDKILGWVWNRLYDGVRLHGVERLHAVADGNEIVYVPCHRSHMDYLLLSYIIYHQGLSIPHIAAGINLNLPVVGALLRRCGAFFLRRSFRGNRLYAAVFQAYLSELQTTGFSIEYFVEGGRSRTGRLLAPKSGMLSMTVASFVADPTRPLYFVPVYFGYEKMVEGRSFVSELSGAGKQKESLFALTRAVRKLWQRFGEVYVNVGEPIALAEYLDQQVPDWRSAAAGIEENPDTKPDWFSPTVTNLAETIVQRINAAATVTPISLIATALLGTPRRTLDANDLERQLAFFSRLLRVRPYADTVVVPDEPAAEMIRHAESLGVVHRERHALGDLVSMRDRDAVLMTYFRNNIAHLFAIPASIACAFVNGQRVSRAQLQRLVQLSFPYVKRELTVNVREQDLERHVAASIDALLELGLLVAADDGVHLQAAPGGSSEAVQLTLLAEVLVPVLQRYYLTIAILVGRGQGALTQNALEMACELCAQRLAMTYGLRSPDFFDRRLFQLFISGLREQGTVWRNENHRLCFNEGLERVQLDARLMLGEQIHHGILTITRAELITDIVADGDVAESPSEAA
ncbi:MAG: glycerol-3-phosphate 1-O-acyltransferase PlsB [Pseudomonadota bacterium]